MSVGRMAVRSLSLPLIVAVCLALLSAALPAATLAGDGVARAYIVTLAVADSGRAIEPSSKTARARISRRADRAKTATRRVAGDHDLKVRHRYSNTFTGFSARMTPAQAAAVARDAKVAKVRRARKFKTANEVVPNGVKRVLAEPSGSSVADVNIDVAVLDTGVGPTDDDGAPVPIGPSGKRELNIAGGINCADSGADPGHYGDTHGHGTHVAGIIGARQNGVGTVGVAPGARLWSVRSFGGAYGSEEAILCGLDWVNATHSNSNPDIDVLNMSIEGPRLDYLEDCGEILGNPDADPMHQGICTATQLGITVVAAAGNSHENANQSSPGGFDVVVSVGALADFDGAGGGHDPTAPCSSGNSQTDDTYATFSNYGPEVDIMAPGVCVESTYPAASGAVTQIMYGTSQAAPHVTGAVARYLAQYPSTSPDKMRKIVRAAGRMDWEPASDKLWSGIYDSDDPGRVLDVKAMLGDKRAKVWLYDEGFTVSGTEKTRVTRVDIQRRGAFAGTAYLSLNGLLGSVGTATFEQSELQWLTGLGTRLTLKLKTTGPDGDYDLGIKANGSGIDAHTRPLDLKVDRTGPIASGLNARLRSGGVSLAANGLAESKLEWQVKDTLSKVASAKLQRKIGNGSWHDVGSTRVDLKKGQANKFRVKAFDNLGNMSKGTAIPATLWVRDSKSSRWDVPRSDWKTRSISDARGGSVLLTKGGSKSLTTTFKGKSVAIVSSVGPGRGTFRVRVDGGYWVKVSLKEPKTAHRRVVWARRVDGGTHTLEIQGVQGQSVVDAALILQ